MPEEIDVLLDEVATVAHSRSSSHADDRSRHAEFFCVDTATVECLAIVVGDGPGVSGVIQLERPASGPAREYAVQLLQLGGPRDSGVLEGMYGRLVRCRGDALPSHSALQGFPPPTSAAVWARGLLAADTGDVLGFAVAIDRDALAGSLRELCASNDPAGDYDEVAYHFFRS